MAFYLGDIGRSRIYYEVKFLAFCLSTFLLSKNNKRFLSLYVLGKSPFFQLCCKLFPSMLVLGAITFFLHKARQLTIPEVHGLA